MKASPYVDKAIAVQAQIKMTPQMAGSIESVIKQKHISQRTELQVEHCSGPNKGLAAVDLYEF